MSPRQQFPAGKGSKEVRFSDEDRASMYALSAQILDESLKRCGMTRDEAAYILRVSRSEIDKCCNPNGRRALSHVQLMRMPLAFQLAHRAVLDQHFGHAREAIARLEEIVLGHTVMLKALLGDG